MWYLNNINIIKICIIRNLNVINVRKASTKVDYQKILDDNNGGEDPNKNFNWADLKKKIGEGDSYVINSNTKKAFKEIDLIESTNAIENSKMLKILKPSFGDVHKIKSAENYKQIIRVEEENIKYYNEKIIDNQNLSDVSDTNSEEYINYFQDQIHQSNDVISFNSHMLDSYYPLHENTSNYISNMTTNNQINDNIIENFNIIDIIDILADCLRAILTSCTTHWLLTISGVVVVCIISFNIGNIRCRVRTETSSVGMNELENNPNNIIINIIESVKNLVKFIFKKLARLINKS